VVTLANLSCIGILLDVIEDLNIRVSGTAKASAKIFNLVTVRTTSFILINLVKFWSK